MEHAGTLDAHMPGESDTADIKRQIASYNAERATVFRSGVRRVVLVVAGMTALLALMLFLGLGPNRKVGIVILLAAGPIGVLGFWLGLKWAWQPVRDHARSLRHQMFPIAFRFVERIRYRNGVSPGFIDGAKRLGLVHFTRSETDDAIDGRYEGLTFALALTRLTTGSGKTQRTVFRGLVLHAVLEREFAGRIVVARRHSHWLAEIVNALFPGSDAVLETGVEQLDEAYAIHTDNPDAARAMLSSRLVPTLQFLRRIWRSADIRIALSGRECYFMLASERELFVLPGPREDVDYERHVKPMIRDLVEMLAVARLLSKL